jgi:hypothetical protein
MVGQNSKKSNAKETTFFYFIRSDVKIYLCKKIIHHNKLKNVNILNKWLKLLLIHMKFIIPIKHCDSIWLE